MERHDDRSVAFKKDVMEEEDPDPEVSPSGAITTRTAEDECCLSMLRARSRTALGVDDETIRIS